MSTLAVIQARMGSTRLPGKVLMDLGGQPMLRYMLERLSDSPVDQVVVATSVEPSDEAVADVAAAAGVPCVRGPEADVLARFALASQRHPCSTIVRLTADCPLVDPTIIEAALALFEETGAAYVSNTIIRTFPDGLDVEIMTSEALERANAEAIDLAEREHVTPFIYRRPQQFSLAALCTPLRAGSERWTVDTAEDLAFVRGVVGVADHLPWQQILRTVGRRNRPPAGRVVLEQSIGTDQSPAVHGPANPSTPTTFAPSDDPSRRVWRASLDEEWVGDVQVDITDVGVGTLSLALPTGVEDHLVSEVLRAVQESLTSDYQVTHLVAICTPADDVLISAAERTGFRVQRDGPECRCTWIRP